MLDVLESDAKIVSAWRVGDISAISALADMQMRTRLTPSSRTAEHTGINVRVATSMNLCAHGQPLGRCTFDELYSLDAMICRMVTVWM